MSILSYTYVAHIHNAYSVARRILYRMAHNRVGLVDSYLKHMKVKMCFRKQMCYAYFK
jgi:hypothetical protein